MNSQNQVGIVKRNAMTELADQIKAMNAGRPAGQYTGAPVTALTGPRVSSAAMLGPPEILDKATQDDLDAKARAVGALPPLEEDDLMKLEKAKAEEENELIRLGLKEYEKNPTIPMTAREYLGAHPGLFNRVQSVPKLIDFTNIQGIDLVKGVAIVDSVEILIPSDEINKITKRVLKLISEHIASQFKSALKPPRKAKRKKNVRPEEKGSEVQQFSPGDSETITK